MPLLTSYGVAVVQEGLEKSTRPLPENISPPLLVIAFTTPPVNRPNSAGRPDVSTCVSAMASSTNRSCGCASRLSLTSTPLIMKTLSKANAPLMTSWFLFCGPFCVSPGESCAMPKSVRGFASFSICSCLKFAPTAGLTICAGVSATTVIVSFTAAGRSSAFASTDSPSGSATVWFTAAKPSSSNFKM